MYSEWGIIGLVVVMPPRPHPQTLLPERDNLGGRFLAFLMPIRPPSSVVNFSLKWLISQKWPDNFFSFLAWSFLRNRKLKKHGVARICFRTYMTYYICVSYKLSSYDVPFLS